MKRLLILILIFCSNLYSSGYKIDIDKTIKSFEKKFPSEASLILEFGIKAKDETVIALDEYFNRMDEINSKNKKIATNSFFINSFKKYHNLANKNNSSAQYIIYYMYSKGYGVKKNSDKAFFWLKKSYKNNNQHAIFEFTKKYIKKDINKKLKLLNMLSEDNFRKAHTELGNMYSLGKDVKRNIKKSIIFFKKATDLNDRYAQYKLSKFYLIEGKNIALGLDYLRVSVDNDFPDAVAKLANMYFNGKYVEKNYEKAFNLYVRGISSIDAKAFYQIALMYDKGLYVGKNSELALFFYKLSSNFRYPKAQYILALNNYIKLDLLKMHDLLKDSSSYSGYDKSTYLLGLIYAHGINTEKNIKLAKEYFFGAASKKHSESLYSLGEIYEYGIGEKANREQAKKYYYKSLQYALKDKNCALLNAIISKYNTSSFRSEIINYLEKNDQTKIIKDCKSFKGVTYASINSSIKSTLYWRMYFKYEKNNLDKIDNK